MSSIKCCIKAVALPKARSRENLKILEDGQTILKILNENMNCNYKTKTTEFVAYAIIIKI